MNADRQIMLMTPWPGGDLRPYSLTGNTSTVDLIQGTRMTTGGGFKSGTKTALTCASNPDVSHFAVFAVLNPCGRPLRPMCRS
jgi:hypothetical protein